MISVYDIEHAVEETHRVVEELGFKAIFLRSNIVNGKNWHDPYYEPLWDTLEKLDIPLGFHEASGSCVAPDRRTVRRRTSGCGASTRSRSSRCSRSAASSPAASWRAIRGCGSRSSRRTAAGCRGCSGGWTNRYELEGDLFMPELTDGAERVLPAPVLRLGRARRDSGALHDRRPSAAISSSTRPTTRTATRATRTRPRASSSCRSRTTTSARSSGTTARGSIMCPRPPPPRFGGRIVRESALSGLELASVAVPPSTRFPLG